MVTKEGANLQATAESLKGKTVGVQQGTIQETFAKQKLAPNGVNVQSYQNQDQVYADLVSGRIDVAMQDMLQAEGGFMKSPQGKGYTNTAIHDELLPADTAIGIRKGQRRVQDLRQQGYRGHPRRRHLRQDPEEVLRRPEPLRSQVRSVRQTPPVPPGAFYV